MTGVGTLLRARLRRDRWQLVLWIGGTVLLAASAYAGVRDAYGTLHDREALLATVMANPVILLFRGLPSGADEGAFMLFLLLPFLAMTAAFMSSFLAVRHTRTEEEDGRAELVGSTPAGRLTPLIATLAEGALANLVLAVGVAVAYLAFAEPVAGSLLAGAAAGAVGLSFLGVSLLGAQLFRTARGANAFGVWAIMATFLFAGIGNAVGTPSADLQRLESGALAWFSPFGWAEQVRPFADDAAAPLLLCLGLAAVTAGGAAAIAAQRDVGASLLPARLGRATASPLLANHAGLLWRQTWPAIAGWAVGGLLTGLLATRMAATLADAADQLPSIQEILEALTQQGSLAQGSVVIFFTMLGLLAGCCAVQLVCRARQDEAHGTAEPVLATRLSRVRWLADYLVIAAVGIIAIIAAGLAGAAIGLAAQEGADWSLLGDAFVAGGGQAVAAAVFLALTAVVFVVAPRATIPLAWSLVILAIVFGLFGPLFGLPDVLVHASPFAVTPTPGPDGVDQKGLWWLVGIVAVGGAASLVLMRRRELAPAG